jgi:polysaccharide export outer membrane protein
MKKMIMDMTVMRQTSGKGRGNVPSRAYMRVAATLGIAVGILANTVSARMYYASPVGQGDGFSVESPFRVASFRDKARPGDTLILLDGLYTSPESMIKPPKSLSGKSDSPITVCALHDGKVTIDGKGVLQPVALYYNDWWVIEGINACNSKSTVVSLSRSNHCIVRRVCGWNAADGNTNIFAAHYGEHNLFEDCAGWGIARKTFSCSQGGNYTTFRRCFGSWEGCHSVAVLLTAFLGCQGPSESTQSHESITNLAQRELYRARRIRQCMVRGQPADTPKSGRRVVRPAFSPSEPRTVTSPGNPASDQVDNPWVPKVQPVAWESSSSLWNSPIRPHYLMASQREAERGPHLALEPGDIVEVKFYYTPELDVTQMVRPDGKIALQLIGEIDVQGKSPAQVQDEVLRLYEPHLKAPEITVVVRSFYNRRVFVGGAVLTPGTIQIPAKTTVLEAIMQAGGFDMLEARVRNVIVIRHKNGERYVYKVDLGDAIKGKETRPFFLEPEDIIYVPRTKIVEINQWIDQHINKIIPDGFIFRRTLGRSTYGSGTYR